MRVTKANSLRGDPDAIGWDETVWASWGGNVRLGAGLMSAEALAAAPATIGLAAVAVARRLARHGSASAARWVVILPPRCG